MRRPLSSSTALYCDLEATQTVIARRREQAASSRSLAVGLSGAGAVVTALSSAVLYGVQACSALRPENARSATMDDARTSDSLRLGPIGQVSRHVSDIEQAVAWYGGVLSLPHLYTFGDLAFFGCGGTRLFLSLASDAAPVGPPSILYFRVDDIHRAHELLTGRGVKFTGAPHMIFRHESGLEEWMAFFSDPDGQPLAIMTQARARLSSSGD